MKRQRGMALLLALVLSLLLGLLAISALREALEEVRMAGYVVEGVRALEQAEAALLEGAARLSHAPPPLCQLCRPPPRPHDLQGQWQSTSSGYYQVQNLGESSRALHMPEGAQVTLYRVTAVSRQTQARHVLEAVYAQEQTRAPQRIFWRQRLREY